MFFRLMLSLKRSVHMGILNVAALSLLLTISSCVKAKQKPAQKEMALQQNTQCLAGAGTKLENYFNGELSAEEVSKLSNCADSALDQFTEFVKGDEKGRFSAQELSNFMSRYFLDGFEIPVSLQLEVMELKKVILGGDSKYLTLGEIQRVRELIAEFRNEFTRLQPFMPLIPAAYDSWSDDKKKAAIKQILQSSQSLGEIFQQTAGEYTFDRLDTLLYEVERLFPPSARIGGFKWIRENLSVFRAAKVFANGTPSHIILANEWSRIFHVAMRWYAVFLDARNFANQFQGRFDNETHLSRLESLIDQVIALFRDVLEQRPNRVFYFDEIDWFLDFLFPKGTLHFGSWNIRIKDSLKPFARVIVRRMLGGTDFGAEGREAQGLSLKGLEVFSNEVHRWMNIQRLLNSLYREAEFVAGYSGLGFSPSDLSSFGARILAKPQPGGEEVKKEALILIHRFRSLYQVDENYVTFKDSLVDKRVSLTNVTTLNWMRVLSRLLFRGYSEELSRSIDLSGLKKEEMEKFVADFRELGLDLKVFDPRFLDAGKKRHFEGSSFTFHSTGKPLLNMDSFNEQLTYLISAKKLANQVHESIAAQCQSFSEAENDPVGYPRIEPNCYRKVFFTNHPRPGVKNYEQYWARMPALLNYYKNLSPSGQAVFQENLEVAARRGGYSNKPFEIDDTETISTMLHYIEAVFQRFDTNHMGTIDQEEAKAAFEVFQGTIQNAARNMGFELTDRGDVEALFNYLLAFGEVPKISPHFFQGLLDMGDYGWWQLTYRNRSYECDRGTILRIFALFSSAL